jgi:hypothetical protein
MNGKRICHDLDHSLTIAQLCTILENDNGIPSNSCFIHNENYTITTATEKTITVGRLLNKDIQPVSKFDSITVHSKNKVITVNDLNSKTWEQVFKI